MSLQSYAFVELKSFGDLVMAAASLRLLSTADLARCRLVIGPYLQDLSRTLAPPCQVEVLDIPDRNVPALFDIKKRGVAAGIWSALSLRSALSRAAHGTTLVMESQARRERFIAGRRDCLAIPRADNVYLAFEAFMAGTFGTVTAATTLARDPSRPRRIALCPFSRVAAKNIPSEVVVALAQACERTGFEPELLQLEGERFEHPEAPPARVIPRRFDALADALADYAAAISADSLPAHLAEYRGTPAFIISPIENRYWLPKHAFQGDHWGLIPDRDQLMTRLQRFLDLAQS